jgi:hypothetical protein
MLNLFRRFRARRCLGGYGETKIEMLIVHGSDHLIFGSLDDRKEAVVADAVGMGASAKLLQYRQALRLTAIPRIDSRPRTHQAGRRNLI